MTTRLIEEEFPDFGPLPFDPEKYGMTDQSWHNDAMPHFAISLPTGEALEALWIDYADVDKRDMPEATKRFCYVEYPDPGEQDSVTIFETDDAAEMERFIDTRIAKQIEMAYFAGHRFTWEYPGFLMAPSTPGYNFTVGLDEDDVRFLVQVTTEDGEFVEQFSPECNTRQEVIDALDKLRKHIKESRGPKKRRSA